MIVMIIGFDMDGVIINHVERKVYLAKKLGFKIKKEDTPSEVLKTKMPLPEYRRLQHLLYDNPRTCLSSSPMPGVEKILLAVKKKNLPLFLISRRKVDQTAIKLLRRHGLWPRYFNEQNTFFVKEVEDKNTKAKELGITHYIDDEQKVLNSLVDVKNKFLFDKLDIFKESKYPRLKSWAEFSKLI